MFLAAEDIFEPGALKVMLRMRGNLHKDVTNVCIHANENTPALVCQMKRKAAAERVAGEREVDMFFVHTLIHALSYAILNAGGFGNVQWNMLSRMVSFKTLMKVDGTTIRPKVKRKRTLVFSSI